MPETFIDGLFISSMIIFHIICIAGTVAFISIMFMGRSITKKTNETLNKIQAVADNSQEITATIAEKVAMILKPKSKTLGERIFEYFTNN